MVHVCACVGSAGRGRQVPQCAGLWARPRQLQACGGYGTRFIRSAPGLRRGPAHRQGRCIHSCPVDAGSSGSRAAACQRACHRPHACQSASSPPPMPPAQPAERLRCPFCSSPSALPRRLAGLSPSALPRRRRAGGAQAAHQVDVGAQEVHVVVGAEHAGAAAAVEPHCRVGRVGQVGVPAAHDGKPLEAAGTRWQDEHPARVGQRQRGAGEGR